MINSVNGGAQFSVSNGTISAAITFISNRPLVGLAWLNVFLHLVGLALAAVGIRPGSPLVPLPERLSYLAASPLAWTLAWVAWMCCAATLIAFLAVVTNRLGGEARLAQFGLMIAVAAAGFDLCCDSIYLLVFPMLASLQPPAEALFLLVERVTGLAGLVVANGAYSISILLVTLALRGQPGISRLAVGVGCAVAGFGLLLAAAGITWVPWHAAWATPPTIGLFCLWVILVAYSLQPAGRSP
jgi:hypothetical protein